MPTDADTDATKTCSNKSAPGATTATCGSASPGSAPTGSATPTSAPPAPVRQVVTLKWDKAETWCSEDGPISGTTVNYSDGEVLSIAVTDHADNSAVNTLQGNISSNAFSSPWKIIDVLPTGGPSWKPRRSLDGETAGVKTPTPMDVRFIPNLTRGTKAHTCQYNRTDPGTTTPKQVGVDCRFELESVNYLVTIYGQLKYVRGWGKERLQLGDPSLPGSFTLGSVKNHWGYRDPASGTFKYWNGSAWKDTPASWTADNSNHFGIPFYKSGSTWVCREDSSLSPPQPLSDWPADKYTGSGNITDTTLATWKKNIEAVWTDKFDIKRKDCKSTKAECCRYQTACSAIFQEVSSYGTGIIIIVYDDVRSDSGMWALGDTRYGLAPHEFGHLLGAPDEYGGVGTTQLGVSDSDGLSNGIDDNCIMGVNLSNPKKRHYKGICEMMALLVVDQLGKNYTYEAVAKGTSLASPAGTPATQDSSGGGAGGAIIGAIVGGIVGAVAGAIIGFIASGGNPAGAAAGAVAGAVVGALVGAGIGSLF